MHFFTIASIGIGLCLISAAAQAVEGESLGPFVSTEASRITLISPRCKRNADRIDCQFAATLIYKDEGECHIAMNSYPVPFKLAADGRWLGTTREPNCPSGKTDYKIELLRQDAQAAGARLSISGCFPDRPPTELKYETKAEISQLDCPTISIQGDAATIGYVQHPR